MAVEIIDGGDKAALYCNTTDTAFGPVFESGDQAEQFLAFIRDDARDFRSEQLGMLFDRFKHGQEDGLDCWAGHVRAIKRRGSWTNSRGCPRCGSNEPRDRGTLLHGIVPSPCIHAFHDPIPHEDGRY